MKTWARRFAALIGLVMTLFLAGCGGSSGGTAPADQAPSISTQPAASAVTAGVAANFSVTAAGTAPLSYQWQRDGVNISGATSASYAIASPTLADTGAQFRVVVSNAVGTATSSSAALTVTAATAPSIASQPVGTTVTAGTAANFSVLADGSAPLSYQWQRDGVNISGATAATYSLAAPTAGDSGATFRVVVSNSAGSVTSGNALLQVALSVTAPSIVTQPQSLTSTDGALAVFSVAADGTGPFAYQWRKNGVNISAATLNIYATPVLTTSDTGTVYSVVVTNGGGSVTSANATLTVNYVPATWQAQPAATSAAQGQTALFAAAAVGSLPITYQWQRNGVAITGATGQSYATAATALADDGALYSVVATNPANSITSTAARLTVVATAVAPSIATAPASVTVSEGQVASFTATAAGTAPLAYQWRRNATDIAGATSATYATAATTVADNAARFSVRVTNAAGSVTSADAVLTVQAAAGGLVGRAWSAGQLLETDDNVVRGRVSGIDDAGRVTVVFRKSNGTRDVLYATRGTANASGQSPTWSAPVAIDLLAGTPVSTMGTTSPDFGLVVAPGGNALAYWYHSAPCTAATYSTTSSSCRYYYMAHYTASSNAWAAPVLITDAPSPAFKAFLNDRGDISLMGTSWIRSGTSSYSAVYALFMRNPTEGSFRRQLMNTVPLGNWALNMDAAGNLLLAAEAQQNATTDLVSYRGTVASGLGGQQILDTRGAATTLLTAQVGLNGHQVVIWRQSNGTATALWAAASASAAAPFVVQELGALAIFGETVLTVADSGDALLLSRYYGWRMEWRGGAWATLSNLPANSPTSTFLGCDHARNGNFLCIGNNSFGEGTTGRWATYDASRNVMVQALTTLSTGSGYVLGVGTSNLGVGYETPFLSVSGIGVTTMLNRYDVLPSQAAPAGDGRTLTNLWGAFLK